MFMEKEIERCYRLARNNSQMQFLHSLKEIEEEDEDDKTSERSIKKEWRKNAKLRAEFGSYKTFRAYKRAEKRKAFKVLRK